MECIKVDKVRGIYVYKIDKENIYKLKRRKVDRKLV